jgi:hypothetical protein
VLLAARMTFPSVDAVRYKGGRFSREGMSEAKARPPAMWYCDII